MVSTRRLPGRVHRLSELADIAGSAPVEALGRRQRIFIWCCVVAVTLVAWAYLALLAYQMPAYDATALAETAMAVATPWGPADFFFIFVMWVIMMAGMMAGSATPAMLLFAGMHAKSGASRMPMVVLSFALGYALAWILFSAAATIVQWMLHGAGIFSPAMTISNLHVAGAILCAAGAYQFTRVKTSCLSHCRSPVGFFMTNWRDGMTGALQMGLRHGAHCMGCCWMLMVVLFAVGVMNLLWVAVLTLVVLLEKTGRAGVLVARAAGAAMIVVGIVFLIGGV